jgi:hypothetical protein
LIYTKPTTRLTGHLEGYDPKQAPAFVWPQELVDSKRAIRKEVEEQGKDRKKTYVH